MWHGHLARDRFGKASMVVPPSRDLFGQGRQATEQGGFTTEHTEDTEKKREEEKTLCTPSLSKFPLPFPDCLTNQYQRLSNTVCLEKIPFSIDASSIPITVTLSKVCPLSDENDKDFGLPSVSVSPHSE